MTRVYIRLKTTCARDDDEKLVTPGIVWVKKKDGNVVVYYIGVGWWHYAVALLIGLKFLKKEFPKEQE